MTERTGKKWYQAAMFHASEGLNKAEAAKELGLQPKTLRNEYSQVPAFRHLWDAGEKAYHDVTVDIARLALRSYVHSVVQTMDELMELPIQQRTLPMSRMIRVLVKDLLPVAQGRSEYLDARIPHDDAARHGLLYGGAATWKEFLEGDGDEHTDSGNERGGPLD